MEHKEITSKVGKKASVIWDAYQEVLAELKAVEKAKSTVEVAEAKRTEEVIQVAENVDVNALSNSLQNFAKGLIEAQNTFKGINEAIEAKKSELKEVHNLETEVNSLVAVMATKDKLVADREEQAKTIIDDAKERASVILEQAKEAIVEMRQEAKDEKESTDKTHKREEEQWQYEFSRRKRESLDKFNDELKKANAELADRIKAVVAREEAQDKVQEEINSLKATIEQLERSFETRVGEAIQQTEARIKKSAAIEKTMVEKHYEAQLSIANSQISNLEKQVDSLTKRLERSDELVKEANDRVTSIATGALNAGANAATVSKVAEIAAGAGQKK